MKQNLKLEFSQMVSLLAQQIWASVPANIKVVWIFNSFYLSTVKIYLIKTKKWMQFHAINNFVRKVKSTDWNRNLWTSGHKCYSHYKQKLFDWSSAILSFLAASKAITGNKYWTEGSTLSFYVYSLICHTENHLVAWLDS